MAISAVPKGQVTPWGWGQAQLGTGCQQDVTGQCCATAGGAGLALLPEQMAAGEVGLCPSNVHPSLGASEHQGPARVPSTTPGKVMVPGVSSNPRSCPSHPHQDVLVQLSWSGSSRREPGGTGQSCPCGCKAPHRSCTPPQPGARLSSQGLEQPRGGLELRRGCQVLPQHGTSPVCTEVLFPPLDFPPLGDSTPANPPLPYRALSRTRHAQRR